MKEEKLKRPKPEEARQQKAAAGKREEKKSNAPLYTGIAVALVIILAIAAYAGLGSLSGTSFATFKGNFNSAQRVALVVYFHNTSVYYEQNVCSTDLVEILAAHRNPSTIDFFTINNNTCSYIPNGLGHPANVLTNSSAFCLRTAASEPSLSLNYSSYNHTVITPDHMSVFGNENYFRSCPIAVDIS